MEACQLLWQSLQEVSVSHLSFLNVGFCKLDSVEGAAS